MNSETSLDLNKTSVPNVYARNLVQLLQEQGVPTSQSLKSTGLAKEELAQGGGSITCAQELQLFSNAIVLTKTPDLGLRLGNRERVFHHGVYGYALQTSANVHKAFNILPKYFKLTNAYLCVECKIVEGEYRFYVTEGFPMAGIHRLAVEEMLTAARNCFEDLTEGKLKIKRIVLDYPKPEYASRYREIFQCPIEFDRQFTVLAVDRSQGEIPIRTSDPETSEVCIQRCEQILRLLKEAEGTTDRVRREILQLPCDRRNADRIAEQLHISPRQLRRRLREEGVSFQKVLDEVRFELSKDFLKQTSLRVEDIANLVGFSEINNFRKAFKKWAGVTPSEFRKTVAGFL